MSLSRSKLLKVRILLFDIDGTLIASGGAGRDAIADVFTDEFGLSGLDGIAIDGRTDTGIFEEALALAGVDPTADVVERVMSAYLSRLPEALSSHDGHVLEGVVELLDALENTEAIVGLATGNIVRGAELKLRYYGIWERFVAGGFGDVSADRTEVVVAGIEELARVGGSELAAADPIVIGDTPRDVTAGHAAGARVLGVATGNYDENILRESGADYVLPDLRNTEAALGFLLG